MEGWINARTTNGLVKLNLAACEHVMFDGEQLHLHMSSKHVYFVALLDANEIIKLIGGLPDPPETPAAGIV